MQRACVDVGCTNLTALLLLDQGDTVYRTLTAFVVTFVASVGVSSSAQTPVPRQPAPTTPGSSSQTGQMTILGCLRASTNPTMEMKGTIYTLETMEKSTGATTATPTVSGKEKEAAPKTASRYTLVAAESIGLAKHVDHQVELTGRLTEPPASAAAPTAERRPGEGTQKTGPTGGAHNTFEVTALKMISTSCR